MNKLNAARILMIATIAVIVIFQLYWLRKLYNEEYDSLKRTSDIVFKETMYQLQVNRLDMDSLFKGLPEGDVFSKDMIRVLKVNKDSVHKLSGKPTILLAMDKTSTIQRDTFLKDGRRGRMILRTTTNGVDKTSNLRFNYSINDSLPVEKIDSTFSEGLKKAEIDVKFVVLTTRLDSADKCPGDFCTTKIPVGIFGKNCYMASFSEPTSFLMKQIATQMFLSLLLVVLTVISFVFIYRNLLEHKRLADIKNEFISNITHELKTPIATVTVAIEAMKNFNALQSPERTREYLDIADNELQRLSLLVDKVLKLSMFEQDQLELRFQPVDLKQLAGEIISSMKLQFEKHHARVEFFAPENGAVIQGDKLHLTSMIYNLLDNAIKYSPDKPVIEATITELDNKIRLEIKDNGVGISAEYRDKVFDKFFRVPGGNKHNVKGYGLGLSYVAHIVEKHHGTIKVESEAGVGTKFIIELPKTNEKS